MSQAVGKSDRGRLAPAAPASGGRAGHDLLHDPGLGIGVVLDVPPAALGQLPLTLQVGVTIVAMAAEPVAEQDHPVDLCFPRAEYVQVDIGLRTLEQAVLEPVGLTAPEHIARCL